jgi:F-type H+-transporting ATPase subunit epsilon
MLPDKIQLEIVTPERLLLSQPVDEVVLPSVEGYMGVRPGHAPLLARLDVGEISYRVGDRQRYLSVSGGFAEVLRHSVHVLAETAEPAEEIDAARAQLAKERAESRLKVELSEHEFRVAEASLKRAISRMQVQRRALG